MSSIAHTSNLSLLRRCRRSNDAVQSGALFDAQLSFAQHSLNLLKLKQNLSRCSGSRSQVRGIPRASSAELVDDIILEKEERGKENGRALKVGLICGGPSAERGISLNSARSVLDHIQGDDLHVSCYYIDSNLNAYAISSAQLYSNTPADFDFKLESLAQSFQTLSEFAKHLATAVDIVFPVIHGQFGEDGGIQDLMSAVKLLTSIKHQWNLANLDS